VAVNLLESIFPAAVSPRDAAVAVQVAAARSGCVLASLSHLGALELSGADAVRFLHGQCTQDVKARKEHEGGYGFLLDARGKNLGDLHFLVLADRIHCVIGGDLQTTAAWLDRFVIASDVHIAVRDDLSAILVAGARAPSMLASVLGLALPSAEDHSVDDGNAFVVADHRAGAPGFAVWDAPPALALLARRLTALGAVPIGAQGLEVLRIEAGRPRFGADLDESVLPEESGQGTRAVSYTKGCYSGQEVVAKQKYLGKPRRMLTGITSPEIVPTPAALSARDGDVVGRVTSCAWSHERGRAIGLAMVRTPVPAPGSRLVAYPDIEVEVAALPFTPASPA
jgi:tRNA-modifying protein YgfZ